MSVFARMTRETTPAYLLRRDRKSFESWSCAAPSRGPSRSVLSSSCEVDRGPELGSRFTGEASQRASTTVCFGALIVRSHVRSKMA